MGVMRDSDIFDRLTRDIDIEAELRGFCNELLWDLSVRIKTTCHSYGGGKLEAMVNNEKIRRWDAHYEKEVTSERTSNEMSIEDYPAGATAAEGMDAAMGGTYL